MRPHQGIFHQNEHTTFDNIKISIFKLPFSPRSHACFAAHAERDLLLLFGGEHFDGQVTHMFNELFIYNIKVIFEVYFQNF